MRCATNVPTVFPVCRHGNGNFSCNRYINSPESEDGEDIIPLEDNVLVPWTGWKRLSQPCTMEVWLCS